MNFLKNFKNRISYLYSYNAIVYLKTEYISDINFNKLILPLRLKLKQENNLLYYNNLSNSQLQHILKYYTNWEYSSIIDTIQIFFK
jgi:hypothetical protein